MGEKQDFGASFGRDGVEFRGFSSVVDSKSTEKTRLQPQPCQRNLVPYI